MTKTHFILLLSIILIVLVSTSGCKKEEQETVSKFELRFTNTSDNPYLVQVSRTSSSLQGQTFKGYNLERGNYAWKVTQQSGYILYPAVEEGTLNLHRDKEVVFP